MQNNSDSPTVQHLTVPHHYITFSCKNMHLVYIIMQVQYEQYPRQTFFGLYYEFQLQSLNL